MCRTLNPEQTKDCLLVSCSKSGFRSRNPHGYNSRPLCVYKSVRVWVWVIGSFVTITKEYTKVTRRSQGEERRRGERSWSRPLKLTPTHWVFSSSSGFPSDGWTSHGRRSLPGLSVGGEFVWCPFRTSGGVSSADSCFFH